MSDTRIDHLYASYKLVPGCLCQQYQTYAIMLINRLKFMKRSLFMVKTSLLNLVLKDSLCYVRSKLI